MKETAKSSIMNLPDCRSVDAGLVYSGEQKLACGEGARFKVNAHRGPRVRFTDFNNE